MKERRSAFVFLQKNASEALGVTKQLADPPSPLHQQPSTPESILHPETGRKTSRRRHLLGTPGKQDMNVDPEGFCLQQERKRRSLNVGLALVARLAVRSSILIVGLRPHKGIKRDDPRRERLLPNRAASVLHSMNGDEAPAGGGRESAAVRRRRSTKTSLQSLGDFDSQFE
ncbi:hypothetical protein FQA47_001881 [Oryzias melastigma]|uniref:Uncharacterized protein n=1 Tax=Oryzias melastigma TaxID=30732 RepID=A0A834FH26_ORYME|nr:hypothetical protein FQA47_001881 [Oryzias melastigma]